MLAEEVKDRANEVNMGLDQALLEIKKQTIWASRVKEIL